MFTSIYEVLYFPLTHFILCIFTECMSSVHHFKQIYTTHMYFKLELKDVKLFTFKETKVGQTSA